MTTLFLTHPIFLRHDTGPGHPERAARLEAVTRALEGVSFVPLHRAQADKASREDLLRVHDRAYVEGVFARMPAKGVVHLDPDTVISPQSGESALFAVGAVMQGVDAVLAGRADNAFCAVRPPGHHSEPGRAMGFCLFNNIAVGALYALEHEGVARVAIVDFDVHHGNGSETVARGRADLFYASSHQSPAYPGTGRADDHGPLGNILNVELPPGTGSAAFRAAYVDKILPAVAAFAPDMILLSAGFDGHGRDPLAAHDLSADDYAWLTGELCALAGRCCSGRIVSVLEGGYDLEALGASVAAHVGGLMGAGD
ncbi:histone deacetylase family protein [Varunaivibrio sulfuroxidans]|uniref:Acetoin utilization deacetylase AcuC-like enzyme n=1 Tax=Varunaivibrio sulfuroxidans TaxID=1773489 RepID=A0A4R3J512_9PROT|nr:histone deacetylase family protein [Varunaivibrio sulfuroxidans]TCS60352.1 acetoin utilization deacetylase AcuC-like enzyme [Varunaivibrio sulfuroxidans]WES30960.1 histone deacetylase family protein [Varunaivibrio sulfuroxidans]